VERERVAFVRGGWSTLAATSEVRAVAPVAECGEVIRAAARIDRRVAACLEAFGWSSLDAVRERRRLVDGQTSGSPTTARLRCEVAVPARAMNS
jgi:hypothetical protein